MKNEEVWKKVRRLGQGETIERKVLALRECCHREGNSIAIQNEYCERNVRTGKRKMEHTLVPT